MIYLQGLSEFVPPPLMRVRNNKYDFGKCYNGWLLEMKRNQNLTKFKQVAPTVKWVTYIMINAVLAHVSSVWLLSLIFREQNLNLMVASKQGISPSCYYCSFNMYLTLIYMALSIFITLLLSVCFQFWWFIVKCRIGNCFADK